jgi:integrase
MTTRRLSLRSVSDEEADLYAKRQKALRHFKRHYKRPNDTESTMVSALRRIALTVSSGTLDEISFPWENLISEENAQIVIDLVAKRYSKATVQRDSAALRQMLRSLKVSQAIQIEEMSDALLFTTPRMPDKRRPVVGRLLTTQDLRKLMETAANSPNKTLAFRNTALLYVAATSGMRRAELAAVHLEDIDWEDHTIFVSNGKGGRSRDAWISPDAAKALKKWLGVRGYQKGLLFNPVDRFGRIGIDTGICTQQIWKTVKALAAESGVDRVTPHDFRRFVISSLLETHDISLAAKVVGHRQITTTAKYDRRPASRARKAVETLSLPSLESIISELKADNPGSPKQLSTTNVT